MVAKIDRVPGVHTRGGPKEGRLEAFSAGACRGPARSSADLRLENFDEELLEGVLGLLGLGTREYRGKVVGFGSRIESGQLLVPLSGVARRG